jgi:broad-specificity NMP kinase
MKRILITGMSGTGKSTVIEQLATLGYKAVDLDNDEFSEWVDVDPYTTSLTPAHGKDWIWKMDPVQQLLSMEDKDILIVSGCAENMGQFLPQFDQVILLSAAPQVLVERLASRTNNIYGKQQHEVEQVLALQQIVEPLLRKASSYEIDTNSGIANVVTIILNLLKN